MEPYKDIDNDSGVVEYEIGADYIIVKFLSGWVYTYTYASTGELNIEQMKLLAQNGDGLNEFINRIVKKNYAKKEK